MGPEVGGLVTEVRIAQEVDDCDRHLPTLELRQDVIEYVRTADPGVAEKAAIDGFFPELVRPKAAAIGPIINETFARAYARGVPIVFGTDTGVSAHGDNAVEFALMVDGGMPPMEAIQSATSVAAEFLDIGDTHGRLLEGYQADIVAVPGNPLDDITLMQQVNFVMKGGVRYK